ncbi:hypothetical protein RRG08_010387 [Elysia crispata]|uniref:Uncharacterized protein n=1 Tax=Elysia crispata TaxID=231223 RepID=A0AAE1BBU1_9GAST|nr:hypothetical protein RRG08_010387 [Elysia crispata]
MIRLTVEQHSDQATGETRRVVYHYPRPGLWQLATSLEMTDIFVKVGRTAFSPPPNPPGVLYKRDTSADSTLHTREPSSRCDVYRTVDVHSRAYQNLQSEQQIKVSTLVFETPLPRPNVLSTSPRK